MSFRRSRFVVVLTVAAAALVVVASCKKSESSSSTQATDSSSTAAHTAKPASTLAHASAPPPPGTDADRKRVEAQAAASTIDAALGTFAKQEHPLVDRGDGYKRKAELWTSKVGERALPKKLVVSTSDDKGKVQDTIDVYFDDRALMHLARASDGIFVFQHESLALWLEPDQTLKRGVLPAQISARVNALKNEVLTALHTFGMR